MAHPTRSVHGPAARVGPGDHLWLVTRVDTPTGPLPPSVDARIDVERVENLGEEGFVYHAAPSSVWFPLCDATDLLRSVCARGMPLLPEHAHGHQVGTWLRTVRQLDDGAPLVAHAANLQAAGYAFVSYRIVDGSRQALALVRRLLAADQAVWWDRWSMPRRVAEDGLAFEASLAGQVIARALDQARSVHVVRSPSYGQAGTWSEWEWERVEEDPRVVVHQVG